MAGIFQRLFGSHRRPANAERRGDVAPGRGRDLRAEIRGGGRVPAIDWDTPKNSSGPALGGLSASDRAGEAKENPKLASEVPAGDGGLRGANLSVTDAAERRDGREGPPPVARLSAETLAIPPRTNGPVLGSPRDRRAGEEEEDGLPRFRFLASEMSLAASGRTASTQALHVLREAFTPTQPKQSVRLFAGRRRELARVVSAIEEWKAHVVIFGERGYGKSSLANVVVEIARQSGITVLTCSCSSEISFEEIFRGFLRDIPLPYRGVPGRAEAGGRTPQAQGNFAGLLPAGPFGAMELAEALRHLTDRHVIFRIDEFDRVRDAEIKNQLAEAIKNLSDLGARVTFLIVGVADDLDELLGKHPSIQRNIVGIHLPLMSEAELSKLIKTGEKAAAIPFDDDVRNRIIALAQGLPYQAQALSFQAALACVEARARSVTSEHLKEAIKKAVTLSPRVYERLFERLLKGSAQDTARATAYAAARARTDEYGTFTLDDVAAAGRSGGPQSPRSDVLQRELEALSREGGIFRVREDHGTLRYAFADPLFRAYLTLLQAS